MTDSLEQTLTDVAPEPSRPPEPDVIWATARRRARRTTGLAATAAVAVVAVVAGGLLASTTGPGTPHVDPLGSDQPHRDEQPVLDDAQQEVEPPADDGAAVDPAPEPGPQPQDTTTEMDPPSKTDRGEEPGPVPGPAEPRDEPASAGWEEHWARLAERSFHTRAYHRDGQRFALVDDTELEVLFTDDPDLGPGMVFHAGCNTHGASLAGITADRLRFGEFSGTAMACANGRTEQEAWLREFFKAEPRWQLDGDRLTLTSGNTRIELTEAPWTVWER